MSGIKIPTLLPARPSWVECYCTHASAHLRMGTGGQDSWSPCVMNRCVFPQGVRTGVLNKAHQKQPHRACSEGCHLLTLQIFSQTMQRLSPASSQFVLKSWFFVVLNPTPAAEGAHSLDTQYCAHITWAVITHVPLPAKTDCHTYSHCHAVSKQIYWHQKEKHFNTD